MVDFSPDNVSKEDMKQLAKQIDEYLNQLESVMIIPDSMIEEYGDKIKDGIKRSRKLVNKLKKGDTSVFKDVDIDSPF